MAGGDYNVICDQSGFKVKASETRKQWNGLRVRKDLWEPRHPQDRLEAVPDFQAVPDPRPDVEPVFEGTNDITVQTLVDAQR